VTTKDCGKLPPYHETIYQLKDRAPAHPRSRTVDKDGKTECALVMLCQEFHVAPSDMQARTLGL
jgi:hypothetical protein